ncbi:porin [Roseovarius aestuarii]|uniref:Porin domain-containing protein n=1 Tax=Roseovarius aestuarii TaxID=475083 RepID=A0A1X7BLV3_9RHOB|nr:porin [Roseovarius aestuarii]SMC10607.1 hypothetical protein ROA7745_00414 [Roseovarius aestuarii]
MKKQLLSTSAIALGVAAAAPASAQSWDLDWGGFINSHVAIVDHSAGAATAGSDFDGLKQFSTGEIIFSPSITLDNGLTFGANVQFEAQNNVGGAANNVDESYIEIKSDTFGRVVLGAENSAGYLLSTGASAVSSLFINSPSISAFLPLSGVVPFNFRQAGISSFTEVAGNNDVNRISYFTPNFNGLVVGFSYAPNNNGNASQGFAPGQIANNTTATLEDIWDIGVNYSGNLGAASVTASARYGEGSGVAAGAPDADVWAVGLNVGIGDFGFGASYAENDNGNGAFGVDQDGWSLGVTYDAPGPWSFGFETYQGNYDNSGTLGADEEYEAYAIAASRDLGPGVDWDIYLVYAEASDNGNAANDDDGTVFGTAINLSF